MVNISMKQLLEAGVHFGHQTRRWNPKMARYIYGERNGIYIIDLQKTVKKLKEATKFVRDVVARGEKILFVGTKKQAKDSIMEESKRCGMYYCNQRWLGGTLTNFRTIEKTIARLKELERLSEESSQEKITKKEKLQVAKELAKLQRSIGGIRDMVKLPGAMFIVDTKKEHNAILEGRKLGIPIVGIVDTNADPDEVDYIVPANDDAIRAVRLISSFMADAALEGADAYRQEMEAKQKADAAAAAGEAVAAQPMEQAMLAAEAAEKAAAVEPAAGA